MKSKMDFQATFHLNCIKRFEISKAFSREKKILASSHSPLEQVLEVVFCFKKHWNPGAGRVMPQRLTISIYSKKKKKKGTKRNSCGFLSQFCFFTFKPVDAWMGGRELLSLGSEITGCCLLKSSGLEGYPLGHPQRTCRKPYFQKEHKVMNFQASWWGRSQRWTDGRGGTAGHSQEWHLSLGMDSRKFSFWLPSISYVEQKSDKSPWQQRLRSLTPAKSLGNTWVEFGLTQKPIEIKRSLCRSPGGFCLNAEMPHKWKRGDGMVETLRRGWEQLLFPFTQELSLFLFLEGPERLCKQEMLKDSLYLVYLGF